MAKITVKILVSDNQKILELKSDAPMDNMLVYPRVIDDAPKQSFISKERNDFRNSIYKESGYKPSIFKFEIYNDIDKSGMTEEEEREVIKQKELEDNKRNEDNTREKKDFLACFRLGTGKPVIYKKFDGRPKNNDKELEIIQLSELAHLRRVDVGVGTSIMVKKVQFLLNHLVSNYDLKIQLTELGDKIILGIAFPEGSEDLQKKYNEIKNRELLKLNGLYDSKMVGYVKEALFVFYTDNEEGDDSERVNNKENDEAIKRLQEFLDNDTTGQKYIVKNKENEDVLWDETDDEDQKFGFMAHFMTVEAIKHLYTKVSKTMNIRLFSEDFSGDSSLYLIKQAVDTLVNEIKYIEGFDKNDFKAFILSIFYEKSRYVHRNPNGSCLVSQGLGLGIGQIPGTYMYSSDEITSKYGEGYGLIGFDFSKTKIGKDFYRNNDAKKRAQYFIETEKNIELTVQIITAYITSKEMDKFLERRLKFEEHTEAEKEYWEIVKVPGEEQKDRAFERVKMAILSYNLYGSVVRNEETQKKITIIQKAKKEAEETIRRIFDAKVYGFGSKENLKSGCTALEYFRVVIAEGMEWQELRKVKHVIESDWYKRLYINNTTASEKNNIFNEMTEEDKDNVLAELKTVGYYSQRDNEGMELDKEVYWFSQEQLKKTWDDGWWLGRYTKYITWEEYKKYGGKADGSGIFADDYDEDAFFHDKKEVINANEMNKITKAERKYRSIKNDLVDGSEQEKADRMCNVTSLAMALNELGVENLSTMLQFEDYLDAEIEADDDLNNKGNNKEYAAREYAWVLEKLAKKVVSHAKYYDFTPSEIETNTIGKIKELFDDTFEQSKVYIFRTLLGGQGHYVFYLKHNDDGIYILDPYGQPKNNKYYNGGKKNTDLQWYGYNNFYTWGEVKDFKIGLGRGYVEISN